MILKPLAEFDMELDSQVVNVRAITPDDIDSLSTIIPRSFAPDAPLNRMFPPDSLLTQQWWVQVYQKATEMESFHVLVAVQHSGIIGVLTMQFWKPDNPASSAKGICSLVPLTKDHDTSLNDALRQQTTLRQQYVGTLPNYMIDLMAVDRSYQGNGIGRLLVNEACRIADERQAAVFLQTTDAKQFYLKLNIGFQLCGDANSGVLVRLARHA